MRRGSFRNGNSSIIVDVKPKVIDRIYVYGEASYTVHVVFRRGRYMRMRQIDASSFRLGVPLLTPWKSIDDFAIRAIPKLLRGNRKRERRPYDGQYLYVLGEKREVGELTPEQIKRLYKKECYALVEERFRRFEQQMGVTPPYTLRFRSMKTRLGSNSKQTHTIAISYDLLAYDLPVVDSVLYHELAHHFRFDHSPKFYKRILRHDYERKDHLESQSAR